MIEKYLPGALKFAFEGIKYWPKHTIRGRIYFFLAYAYLGKQTENKWSTRWEDVLESFRSGRIDKAISEYGLKEWGFEFLED